MGLLDAGRINIFEQENFDSPVLIKNKVRRELSSGGIKMFHRRIAGDKD